MSRVSRKSELSPSVTSGGSNNIDLGKRDIDMGGKSSPSVTSGGIGVSSEIANIGGVSVTGGVSVDLSPIDLGINYDPTENSLGIAGGAEVPGGWLGASGGVTIDLDTGEITGVQAGGEALGIGISASASKDGGIGFGISIQIPFTPIEIELGFGLPPKGEKPNRTPTPTPTPSPTNPNNIPTTKRCDGGNFELWGVVGEEDGARRLYPLEEALQKYDAYVNRTYTKADLDNEADSWFGRDNWEAITRSGSTLYGNGRWLFVPFSNNPYGNHKYVVIGDITRLYIHYSDE